MTSASRSPPARARTPTPPTTTDQSGSRSRAPAGRSRSPRRVGGTVASTPAGISCGSDCSESYPEGTDVLLTATPDAGHRFVSWTGACEGITGRVCTVTVNADTAVKATFAPIPTDPPVANLAVTNPTKKLPVTFFDASGTLNATNLAYSISGGKKLGSISNFEVSPEDPFTTLRIKQPGTYTATLTATSPSGSSAITQNFTVPKTSSAVLDPRMPNLAASSYQQAPFTPPSLQFCSSKPETQVVFGQTDLRGKCFYPVLSSKDIPLPERKVAGEWFDSQIGKKCGGGFVQIVPPNASPRRSGWAPSPPSSHSGSTG